MTTLREALVQAAYHQLSLRHNLTIMPLPGSRAVVPSHWREEAEREAKPYIEAIEAAFSESRNEMVGALRANLWGWDEYEADGAVNFRDDDIDSEVATDRIIDYVMNGRPRGDQPDDQH